MNIYDALSAAVSAALDEWPEHNRVDEHEAATGAVVDAIRRVVDAHTAELRAENERLRAGLYPLGQHTIEWAEGLATDIGASPDSLFVGWVNERKRAEKAEAERDAALAKAAEAEGTARTNAAWVQQQHAAAKEAREQRDALQRHATRVRRHVESKAVTSRAHGRADEEREWLDVLALLDAVEPADQPHPTPEADMAHEVRPRVVTMADLAASKRHLDSLPCPFCGGDRLRPDFTDADRCHAPRPDEAGS